MRDAQQERALPAKPCPTRVINERQLKH